MMERGMFFAVLLLLLIVIITLTYILIKNIIEGKILLGLI